MFKYTRFLRELVLPDTPSCKQTVDLKSTVRVQLNRRVVGSKAETALRLGRQVPLALPPTP